MSIEAMCAAAQSLLEANGGVVYETSASFDALSRPTQTVHPDGSIERPNYNDRGLLESVSLEHAVGTMQSLLEAVDHDEKGRSTLAVPGAEGVEMRYEYDPRTFRLRRMLTRCPGDVPNLQDLRYWYDPVGHITRQEDASQPTVFFRNQAARAANDFFMNGFRSAQGWNGP